MNRSRISPSLLAIAFLLSPLAGLPATAAPGDPVLVEMTVTNPPDGETPVVRNLMELRGTLVSKDEGNQPPILGLTATIVALTVTFSLSAFDQEGSVASWSLDVDNDGSPEYAGSGGPPSQQVHTYPDPGTYTARLRATDDAGATAQATKIVTVSTLTPPVADISATANGLDVTYSLSGTDPDGSISSWSLDYQDDGTADDGGTGAPPATRSHTFGAAGTYTARLKVVDNDGLEGEDSTTITVTALVPAGDTVLWLRRTTLPVGNADSAATADGPVMLEEAPTLPAPAVIEQFGLWFNPPRPELVPGTGITSAPTEAAWLSGDTYILSSTPVTAVWWASTVGDAGLIDTTHFVPELWARSGAGPWFLLASEEHVPPTAIEMSAGVPIRYSHDFAGAFTTGGPVQLLFRIVLTFIDTEGAHLFYYDSVDMPSCLVLGDEGGCDVPEVAPMVGGLPAGFVGPPAPGSDLVGPPAPDGLAGPGSLLPPVPGPQTAADPVGDGLTPFTDFNGLRATHTSSMISIDIGVESLAHSLELEDQVEYRLYVNGHEFGICYQLGEPVLYSYFGTPDEGNIPVTAEYDFEEGNIHVDLPLSLAPDWSLSDPTLPAALSAASYVGPSCTFTGGNTVVLFDRVPDSGTIQSVPAGPPPPPLVVSAGGPYFGVTDQAIPITGGASGGSPPYTFEWSGADATFGSTSNPVTTVTYPSPGTYTITLSVEDAAEGSASSPTAVTVTDGDDPPPPPPPPPPTGSTPPRGTIEVRKDSCTGFLLQTHRVEATDGTYPFLIYVDTNLLPNGQNLILACFRGDGFVPVENVRTVRVDNAPAGADPPAAAPPAPLQFELLAANGRVQPGQSLPVDLRVTNPAASTQEFDGVLQIDGGWSVSPGHLQDSIPGNQERSYGVIVTASSSPSSIYLRGSFTSGNNVVERLVRLEALDLSHSVALSLRPVTRGPTGLQVTVTLRNLVQETVAVQGEAAVGIQRVPFARTLGPMATENLQLVVPVKDERAKMLVVTANVQGEAPVTLSSGVPAAPASMDTDEAPPRVAVARVLIEAAVASIQNGQALVKGRVLVNGMPAAAVPVTVTADGTPQTLTTDADGRFEVLVPLEAQKIALEAEGVQRVVHLGSASSKDTGAPMAAPAFLPAVLLVLLGLVFVRAVRKRRGA